MISIYLGGCSGLANPVDIDGAPLAIGDKLTWNFGESKNVAPWMMEPFFEIVRHESGGMCGIGIGDKNKYYLHDFCFQYCRKITEKA